MSEMSLEQTSNLSSLRKQWAALSLTGASTVAAITIWLHLSWGPEPASRWLLSSSCLSLYFCHSLWRGLRFNYRAGETELLPGLGPGNLLTVLRGFLIALLAGFLLSPRPPGDLAWLPGLIMAGITISDILDGYLARRSNHATRLGEMLDMQFDGLSLLVASALIVLYRQAPAWFLLVGLARYLFLAGTFLRRRLWKPVFDLPPSAARRPFAGAQMGFTAVLLFPLFSPPGTDLAAALFAFPFLAGFTLDWLHVSGAIPQDKHFSISSKRFLLHWLPVGLRVILVAGLIWKIAGLLTSDPGVGISLADPVILLIFGMFSISSALLAAGAAGRAAALLALIAVGLQIRSQAPEAIDQVLIILSTALFFLGSGAVSLWRPEEGLIRRRFGEKPGLEA